LPATSQKPLGNRQFTVRLDDDRASLLERIADALADGSKSQGIAALIDLYGGKILERYEQEIEAAKQPPMEVTRWRVPKLSTELIAYMAGLVRAGNMTEVACQMAGISPRQKAAWFKRGRNDRQEGRETLHADFVAALERAEAECEAEDIALLRKHGRTTWTALAWRLERQYPDRYAQRKRIDGKVQHSVFPVVDWDRLSPVETRTLVELLRKASPDLDEPGVSRLARPAMELVPADVVETIDGDFTELPDLE
jgi:hypothetical protein